MTSPSENTYIYGPAGSGKTSLLYSLAREALDHGSLVYLVSSPASASDDSARLIRVTGQSMQEAYAEMLRRLTTGETAPEMLVLVDDFHVHAERRHKPRGASAKILRTWEAEVASRDNFLKVAKQLLRGGKAAGVRVIVATADPYARGRVITGLTEMMPSKILLTADHIPSIGVALFAFGDEQGEEAWEILERNGGAPGTGAALVRGRLIAWGHTDSHRPSDPADPLVSRPVTRSWSETDAWNAAFDRIAKNAGIDSEESKLAPPVARPGAIYTQGEIFGRAKSVGIAGLPLTDLDRLALVAQLLSAADYSLPGCVAHVRNNQRRILPWIKRGMSVYSVVAWLNIDQEALRGAVPTPLPRTRPAPALVAQGPFTAAQLDDAALSVHIARKALTPLEQLGLIQLARILDRSEGSQLHNVTADQAELLAEAAKEMPLEALARLGRWWSR